MLDRPGEGIGTPAIQDLLAEVAEHGMGVAEPFMRALLELGRDAGAGPGVLGALADPTLPAVVRTRALARVADRLTRPREAPRPG